MIDLAQLRKDAKTVTEQHTSMAGDVAAQILWLLDHPQDLADGLGYRLVAKPQLLGKGVQAERPWA
jgi:hypothetical protein